MTRTVEVSLHDPLSGVSGRSSSHADRGLPEAQVATLSEVAALYAAGCAFEPGALVTPRAGFDLKGVGEPHVVLEVFNPPHRFFNRESEDHSGHLSRTDMRVALIAMSGDVRTFAVESWRFEPYPVAGREG